MASREVGTGSWCLTWRKLEDREQGQWDVVEPVTTLWFGCPKNSKGHARFSNILERWSTWFFFPVSCKLFVILVGSLGSYYLTLVCLLIYWYFDVWFASLCMFTISFWCRGSVLKHLMYFSFRCKLFVTLVVRLGYYYLTLDCLVIYWNFYVELLVYVCLLFIFYV